MDYKELAARTHLDERRIKAVMQKDFAELKSLNISMLLHVLERETGEDFSTWKEEYEAWRSEHEEVSKQPKIAPKVHGFNNNKSTEKSNNPGVKKKFFLLVLLILLGAGAYYHEQITEIFERVNNDTSAVVETKNPESSPVVLLKEPSDPEPAVESAEPEPEATLEPAAEPEAAAERESALEPAKQPEASSENLALNKPATLSITPEKSAWLSIKDLTTNKTIKFAVDKPYKIQSPSLVFVGTTAYNLRLGSKDINHSGRYFIYDDSGIRFLSKSEFDKLDSEK